MGALVTNDTVRNSAEINKKASKIVAIPKIKLTQSQENF